MAIESDKKRKIVVLTLTENCNLECVYCFEKEKTRRTMSIQVAKNAIAYEFNNSDGYDEIEFDLFGGEPTLRKTLIRELVEWTEAQSFQRPYLFFLETNGTLVHGKFQEWLQRHKGVVYAGLSLDGTPETHNRNRSNSYNDIDIQFFLKNYPEQSVRMTVNSSTIGNLSKDIEHLHDLGFLDVVATFAHGIAWGQEQVKSLRHELQKLCDYYLAHPEISESSIFDMSLPRILRVEKIERWCGTGTSMVSYGIDGTRYPCHVFQSNATGASAAIRLGEICFERIADSRDPECSGCILEPICPNCYGMNYVTNGHVSQRDKRLCEVVKVRALAVSYLRAQQIDRNLATLNPTKIYQTIAAIKAIQRDFST